MGKIEQEGNETPKYSFRETQRYVNGRSFSTDAMRAGLVIGNKTEIRFTGRQGSNLIVVGILSPHIEGNESPSAQVATHFIKLFKRYEYEDVGPHGVRFLIRATTQRWEGVSVLRFLIDTNSSIDRIKVSTKRGRY